MQRVVRTLYPAVSGAEKPKRYAQNLIRRDEKFILIRTYEDGGSKEFEISLEAYLFGKVIRTNYLQTADTAELEDIAKDVGVTVKSIARHIDYMVGLEFEALHEEDKPVHQDLFEQLKDPKMENKGKYTFISLEREVLIPPQDNLGKALQELENIDLVIRKKSTAIRLGYHTVLES